MHRQYRHDERRAEGTRLSASIDPSIVQGRDVI